VTRTDFDAVRIARLDRVSSSRDLTLVCRVDSGSRTPTSLVGGRCSTTVRRHDGEEGETGADSFRNVSWLEASGNDPGPIVCGPFISRGAATMSDVVENRAKRTRGEGFGGERGSRGRRPLFR